MDFTRIQALHYSRLYKA